ncbi:hypothetical protein MPSEU_000261400 [Mayamaea pseudoterrestris]|nr:hypothetical protein MPSEU_000261400 [Mayamaea pseudoterrestris]
MTSKIMHSSSPLTFFDRPLLHHYYTPTRSLGTSSSLWCQSIMSEACSSSHPVAVVASTLPALLLKRAARRRGGSGKRFKSSISAAAAAANIPTFRQGTTHYAAVTAFVSPLQQTRSFAAATSSVTSAAALPRKVSNAETYLDVTQQQGLQQLHQVQQQKPLLRHILGGSIDRVAAFPQIVGHRGAPYLELENTLPGFTRCVAIGCHAVELDVFLLRDEKSTTTASTTSHYNFDRLVCFHGGGGDQTPGNLSHYVLNFGHRNVRDLSVAEIRQLRFNPHHDEFPCPSERIQKAKVPTLEAVLVALKDSGTRVQVELKGHAKANVLQQQHEQDAAYINTNIDVLEPCLTLVEKLQMMDQVRFSSFDHDLLRALHTMQPDAILGALWNDVLPSDYIKQSVDCGAREVHLRYDTCTAARVAEIHRAGLTSLAWVRGPVGMRRDFMERYSSSKQGTDDDGEDAECYRAILNTGVQQICCNKPDLLKQVLMEHGRYFAPRRKV